jgi:ubiquinone/menaquinone biosynthesis C-methylase UbiE
MTTKEPASPRDRYAPLQREYAANSSDYNRRWKRYIAASIGETLTRVRLEPGTRLLDVGCGTGELLVQLADIQPSAGYIGTDLSARMLNIARDRLGPSTDLFQAAIEALPLADGCIDVLTSTSVFHFVREPQKALSEMRRVLRPGGRLVLTDWCRDFLTMRLLDGYLKTFDAAHHHSYGSGEFARLLEEHDFGGIHVSRYRVSRFWGLFTATAICPAG